MVGKNMKRFTINDVLTLRPCGWDGVHNGENYTREKLNRLFAGRQTLTLADVVDMQEVPPADVVWLACHMFTPRQRVVFVLKCAEDAGISAWEAKWDAARDAAWAARYAALDAALDAQYAAWDVRYAARAARYAARYAARDAAWDAGYAAWEAAGAAWDAAWEAAERQLLFIAETILEEAG